MNIAAITKQVQQHSSLTAHPLAASPFAQKQKHPFLPETAQGKQGSILNQIADRMVDKFEQIETLESKIRTHEVRMEEQTSTTSISTLERMEPEVQQMYLRIYELLGQSADQQEKELTAFREHLESLDQLIQNYQDMVDGKSSLADGLTMEEALDLLVATKQTREDYLQKGAEYLNRYADELAGDHFDRAFQNVFGENPFAKKQASDWMIDISADDIYAEIDRVIGNVRAASKVIKNGIHRIADALEKNGYGEYKYRLHKASLEEPTVDEQKSYLTELLETLNYEARRKRIHKAAMQHPDAMKSRGVDFLA